MKKREDTMPLWVYVILIVVISFLASRFGWKIYGYSQCTTQLIINQVQVEDGKVTVQGTNPYASAFGGFIGTTYKQEGGTLIIGIKYNTLLGILPTDKNFFSYDYQVEGEIDTVLLQGDEQQSIIWQADSVKNDQISIMVEINNILIDTIGYSCYLADEKIASGDIALENARDFTIPLVFLKSDFPEGTDMSTFELGFVLKGENEELEVPGRACPGVEWGESTKIVIEAMEDEVTMRVEE